MALCLFAAIGATPVFIETLSATVTEISSTTTSQTIRITGTKKSGNGATLKNTTNAQIDVDYDTYTVYATVNGTRYKTTSLGNNEYGFRANNGFYYTFYYSID